MEVIIICFESDFFGVRSTADVKLKQIIGFNNLDEFMFCSCAIGLKVDN